MLLDLIVKTCVIAIDCLILFVFFFFIECGASPMNVVVCTQASLFTVILIMCEKSYVLLLKDVSLSLSKFSFFLCLPSHIFVSIIEAIM